MNTLIQLMKATKRLWTLGITTTHTFLRRAGKALLKVAFVIVYLPWALRNASWPVQASFVLVAALGLEEMVKALLA